jgi:beta-lactamase superfamily II metal-dependent hydrolase
MPRYRAGRSAELWVFRVEEGLGNASLMRLPDGRFGIVDWGTRDGAALEQVLGIVGKSSVAFVVATHPHEDHTLGLVLLLRAFLKRGIRVERLAFSSSTLRLGSGLTRARQFALENNIPQSRVAAALRPVPGGGLPEPDYLAFGDRWEVRALGPPDTAAAAAEVRAHRRGEEPGNETSAVVLFSFAEPSPAADRILLPGDVTPATLEDARALGRLDAVLSLHNGLVVLPHHGSHRNLPPWFLSCIEGSAAVSAPSHSPHHPHPGVLRAVAQRCHRTGGRLYSTCDALACRHRRFFDESRSARATAQVSHPCFGDLHFLVAKGGHPELLDSSHDGESRRSQGLCGALTPRQARA